MDVLLYGLIGLAVITILVILIKTINFKPVLYPEMKKKYDIDQLRVLESLSQKIQIPTISYLDSKKINKKAFSDFKEHLKSRYPLIMNKLLI